VVDTLEDMLGAEVYHYHSNTAKEPFDGGAWEWHQDYGYWYHNGCLYPHMASVMVALDRADRSNGCLQVIRGSHHAGRINHSTGPANRWARIWSGSTRCSRRWTWFTPRWRRAMACFFTAM